MRSEEIRDARIALWVLTAAIAIGFFLGWTAKANACEDYESCLNPTTDWREVPIKGQDLVGTINTKVEPTEYQILKAIAYKLDEISQKLDHQQGPFNSMIDKAIRKK